MEQKFSPTMSPLSGIQQLQQTHHPTSALAAALQYQAMGQPVPVDVNLSASLGELVTCLNTGLVSKDEYESERSNLLRSFAERSEDRMVLLKSLKDAWDAKMVSDVEFDSISAGLFGGIDGSSGSNTPFGTSIGTSIGGADVGSWIGTSVPDSDVFGGSFPGVDMTANMYHSQSNGQRRGTSAYYPNHNNETSQMYGSSAQAPGGIPIPMHRGSSNSIPGLQNSYTPQPQHLQIHQQPYPVLTPSHPSPNAYGTAYGASPSALSHNLMSQSAPSVHFLQQPMRSNSFGTSSVVGVVPKRAPSLVQQQTTKPKKDWRSKNPPNPMLLNNQIHQMLNSIPPPAESSTSPPPPTTHRGFGASARQYNCDGSASVSEFRLKWRCRWCLCSGKYTPALRKGPLGAKTLCNACGMWYNRHGYLPKDRYREHANDDVYSGASAAQAANNSKGSSTSMSTNGNETADVTSTAMSDRQTSIPKSDATMSSTSPEDTMLMLTSPVLTSPTSPDSMYGSSLPDHTSRSGYPYLSPHQQERHYPYPHHRHSLSMSMAMHYPQSPPIVDMTPPAPSYLGTSVPVAHRDINSMDFQDPDDWLFGQMGANPMAQPVPVPASRRPGGW
ncbi:hypothetical protein DFJ77DRAFT_470824 [Powellomyces hirtus]|nr:hypothetical protein DFJ77DRAFT_470824 [Powellomyces hirtus]